MRRLAPIAAGAVLAGTLLGTAATAAAQSPELERTDSLIAEGRVEAARRALQAWWEGPRERASTAERQRGWWLRAKLTVDPSLARRDYMRLVLEHPGGPHSDDALLRLAQGAEAEGRRGDAASHFGQLLREYPDSPHRLEARRWLDAHGAEESRSGIPGEERRGASADSSAGGPAVPAAGEGPGGGDARAGAGATPSAGARPVALQLGAFRSEGGARALAERARSAGVNGVRLVRVEGSDLIRVRVGRFPDEASAADRRRAVRAHGFEVVLVENADRERSVP